MIAVRSGADDFERKGYGTMSQKQSNELACQMTVLNSS